MTKKTHTPKKTAFPKVKTQIKAGMNKKEMAEKIWIGGR